jgi:hypothetical protein
MKSSRVLLLTCTVLLSSCKDDTTAPRSSAEFSLEIIVKNNIGAPVSNLRVIGGSRTSIHNFNGSDLHSWTNGVYIARLTARDTAHQSLLFRDSVFMVFADVDIGNPPAWIGYTSSAGVLSLTDINRFPGVLSLPPIPETRDDPTPLSNFSVLDTAIFVLLDTLTNKQQVEWRVIQKSANIINVQWTQTLGMAPTVTDLVPLRERDVMMNGIGDAHFNTGAAKPNLDDHTASPLAATALRFDVPMQANVNLSVLQPDGTTMSILFDQRLDAGFYSAVFSVFGNPPMDGSSASQKAFRTSGIEDVPTVWKLHQNYPNPFN